MYSLHYSSWGFCLRTQFNESLGFLTTVLSRQGPQRKRSGSATSQKGPGNSTDGSYRDSCD